MKQAVVITTIYEPSSAVRAYAQKDGIELFIVGDRKTPKHWDCDGARFLSIKDQANIGFQLPNRLPHNHYCRKMVGYLAAAKYGADVIIDTDDDNVPYPNWGFPDFEGSYATIFSSESFLNVYQWFTQQKIWPRGLPLNLINTDFKQKSTSSIREGTVGVWQGLADGDPDVDAIYRLAVEEMCTFDDHEPIVLQEGIVCPFNSQNTAFRREVFSLLYLPTTVSFRFTDILRGLVAQPCLWASGYSLGFTRATVFQERNEHDLMRDFEMEVEMYLQTRDVVEISREAVSDRVSISDNIFRVYRELVKAHVVNDTELTTLELWLRDLEKTTAP